MSDRPPPLARRIADAVLKLRWDSLSPAMQQRVRRSATDYLGCAIGGAARDEWKVALSMAGRGDIPVPGLAETYDPQGAAVILGTTGALLQLHDVYALGGIHPSSTVFPAAWSAWYMSGGDETAFLTALAAGYETANRLSGATYPTQQLAGSTPTATMGAIGAAVAAGLLMGFSAEQLETAISNAAILTPLTPFESLRNHGSAISIHSGATARAGLEGALLAKAGWSAGRTVLEGSDGFPGWAQLLSSDPARIKPEEWDGSSFEQMVWKLFPACFASHPVVEAALRAPDLDTGAITRVRIGMGKGPMLLVAQGPRADVELYDRLMSVRWAAARALTDRSFGSGTIAALDKGDLDQLMSKITIEHHPDIDPLGPAEVAARVSIERSDGPPIEIMHRRKRIGDAHDGKPLGWLNAADAAQLDAKYTDLTTHWDGAGALRDRFAAR